MRAAAPASKAALQFGTSLVHFQRSPAQLGAVQNGYRLVGLAGIAHFHEREAVRTASFAVGYQTDFLCVGVRTKQRT